MTVYVLHVIDRNEGMIKVRTPHSDRRDPHTFDFLFEVIAGPFAGQRGSHRELSNLLCDRVLVLSQMVGICRETGAIMDWVGTGTSGQWVQRHSGSLERAIGDSS